MLLPQNKKFQCACCGACCRQPGFVYLEAGEAERLAEFLKISLYDFTDRYCELLERRHLVLREHFGRVCIFLEAGKCKIYGARPKQCRDFPQAWDTPNSKRYCKVLRNN